jgi:hypothetical protein
MSDYEELIKNLRSVKDTWQTQEEEWMLQAADAIEKLKALTADDIPTAPQEMSARELYSAHQRICKEYNPRRKPVRCAECPLYVNCPRIGDALRIVVMCSPIVEKWAREHPERSEDDANI